ncbi:MAG: glycine/sarcosine/betaine reductase selenoprotein B family protein [Gammaproteobacteria bacterium]|nr:glycine/sarcosine/betaine reductase selenoprotein B family protein [Gammaproteobacteria bacterium]
MPRRQPPIDYIERTREQYASLGYPPYKWVVNDQPPAFEVPSKPVESWRVGLVASGGIYIEGQVAFHFKDDVSYREIDRNVAIEKLRATHFAYDLTDVRRDPNVVFPLATLRALEAAGEIGEVGPRAYTFMGGIYSARKVKDLLAPAIADRLVADEVDVAIMVPV